MPTLGTLKHVYNNTTKDGKLSWGLVIDVDDHGEHKLTLWDKKYAGIDSENNPAVCDVHEFEGKRVVYTAKRGSLKVKGGPEDGERWQATVEEIALEEPMPEKSVREMVAEIEREGSQVVPPAETDQVPAKEPSDALRTLTMAAIDTDLKAHEARVAMLLEVERIAREA